MNYEQATKALRAYFAAQWNNTTPVAYDDVKFTPPAATWVRFTIGHADGYQASMGDPGNNKFRRVGLINAQVFQPAGQGSLDARKKVDLIIQAFQGKETQGIHFYDVQAQEKGDDGNGFYQVNVLIYFRYDTTA